MKLKLLLCFLPVFFITLTGLAQVKNDSASTAFTIALNAKDYTKALQLINDIIAKDPTNEWRYLDRSAVYLEMGEVEDAYLSVEKALNINDKNPEIYNAMAGVFQSSGDLTNAILNYTKAMEHTSPDSVKQKNMYLVNRATAENQKRMFKEAYADCMIAYNIDSSDIVVINTLAITMDEMGKMKESIRLLNKIISIDPNFVGAYVNLGFKYSQMGEYKKSIPYFDKAIKMEPDEGISYNNRGYSKYKLNDLAGALTDVNRSLELYPGNSYAYRNRALILIAQKQTSAACEDIEKALQLNFTEMYGDELEKLKIKNCKPTK